MLLYNALSGPIGSVVSFHGLTGSAKSSVKASIAILSVCLDIVPLGTGLV